MKKEFSFYEFVGILVPGVTLVYFSEMIFELVNKKSVIDFSKVGESIVFLIIAYGIGQILHAIGNLFENIMWKIIGGVPTQWLTKKNHFGIALFDAEQSGKIKSKIFLQFGETPEKDYGRDVYNWLSLHEKITEKRIDIFNANYSQFRGLAVTFYSLTIIVWVFLGWKYILTSFALGVLSNFRMFLFAKLYATEVFRTYLYFDPK